MTADDLRSVVYFGREKGDVSRYINWPEVSDCVLSAFPILRIALEKNREAEILFEAAMVELDMAADSVEENE